MFLLKILRAKGLLISQGPWPEMEIHREAMTSKRVTLNIREN